MASQAVGDFLRFMKDRTVQAGVQNAIQRQGGA